jgi:hypothetical protein
MKTLNDYKLRTKHLAKHWGHGRQTIIQWTNKGAFPYGVIRGLERDTKVYLPSVLKLTPGQVRENIKEKKFVEPVQIFSNSEKVNNNLSIEEKLDKIIGLLEKEAVNRDLFQ